MKRPVYLVLLLLVFGTAFISSCNDDVNTEIVTLTEDEKNDLLTLREEEKLARDVYLYAFDKYGLSISKNISQTEQTHMDKVLQILISYNIPDPADPEIGVFNNTALQDLYNSLTVQADSSELDALIVGATIEDLDIKDIEDFKLRTSKEDILDMYEVLTCGSRNHLRAYYPQVISNDGTYDAQFLSQDDFDAIVNSDREKCGQ